VPAEWPQPTDTWIDWNWYCEITNWGAWVQQGPMGRTMTQTATVADFGLPYRSMRGRRAGEEYSFVNLYPAFKLRASVPTEVLPLGFALNTLLAACVLLGVVEGFAFVRRRMRHGEGHCPLCGYDRAGITMDGACPECGAGAGKK
jgi:hypothetical protein